MYQTITLSKKEQITVIRFTHEASMNAMSQQFLKEFHSAVESVKADEACRVLVLCGSEKVFSAGGNLHEIAAADYETAVLMATNAHYIYDGLLNLEIPVIAALDGIVYGGGLELALRCDIRYCTPHTRMKFPEIDMGIIPGAGGISFLSKYLSPADIAYYVYSCEEIPVDFALNRGIVQKVVSRQELEMEVMKLAKMLVSKPKNALRAAKHEIISTLTSNIHDSLDLEIREFASTLQTDGKEKIADFFNRKRK